MTLEPNDDDTNDSMTSIMASKEILDFGPTENKHENIIQDKRDDLEIDNVNNGEVKLREEDTEHTNNSENEVISSWRVNEEEINSHSSNVIKKSFIREKSLRITSKEKSLSHEGDQKQQVYDKMGEKLRISKRFPASSLDQFYQDIKNMFNIPTESIGSCFSTLIHMIQNQASEHQELKNQLLKEQEKNRAFCFQIEQDQKAHKENIRSDMSRIKGKQEEMMGYVREIQNEIKVREA